MASEHSFDISAEVDMMEVKNALETAKKEIAARYDFKGLAAEVELNEKEKFITLLSSSDNKIDALRYSDLKTYQAKYPTSCDHRDKKRASERWKFKGDAKAKRHA